MTHKPNIRLTGANALYDLIYYETLDTRERTLPVTSHQAARLRKGKRR